jgi:hypothetical protein
MKIGYNFSNVDGIPFEYIKGKCDYPIFMNILVMISALFFGYLVFMASFYVLAKWLFPKIDVSEEEEYSNALEVFEQKKLKEVRQSRRSRIYRFNKQAA